MNDDTVIVSTEDDLQREYERIMASVPYETPGRLRDAVFDGGELCCPNCYDHTHPHASAWSAMRGWLYLAGRNWREVA